MKKKILYLITKSNFGGAQKYVFELASTLPKEEFDVAVAYGGHGKLEEMLLVNGTRTIPLSNLDRDISLSSDIRVFFDLVRLFRKERPDIVHVNSSKIGGLAAVAGRIAGVKKIIFTAHGWPFLEDRSMPSKAIIIFLSWLTAIFSTDTIDITKRTFEPVSHWPLVGKKLHLIYNGIRPIELVANTKIRDQFPAGNIIVGTIAELHPNKGLSYLIEAAEKLPENVSVAIVGTGELKEKLESEIKKRNLSHKVKLPGFMPATEALPNFDIFVLPSVKEGLPYAILEAGSAGLPIVATRVGGIPEIISGGTDGLLVPPKNPTALAEAITTLASDPAMRAAFGSALHQKISNEFSFKRMFSKTAEIYK